MNCLTHESLVELAFAIANGETLAGELRRASEHARTCAACRRELGRTLGTIRALRRTLDESPPAAIGPCLDDNAVAEFVDGVTEGPARDAAERHLASCSRCLREVIDLAALIGETPITARAFDYVVHLANKGVRMIAHPEEGYAPLALEPVPVLGGREEPRVCAWTQAAGDLKFRFSLQQVDQRHVTLGMEVTREAIAPVGTRLTLKNDEAILQSELLSETGRLTLENLAADDYDFEVALPTGEVVPFSLCLRAGE